jgi:ABC-type transport system substrate-binding protein
VARELLGKHGIGPRRRVTLQSLYAANPVTQRMFLAIGAMWRPLGVDLELVGLETRAYSIRLRAGEYDLQDYVPFATIQTIGTFIGRFASDSFLNFMFYNNVEVDRLPGIARSSGFCCATIRSSRCTAPQRIVWWRLVWPGGVTMRRLPPRHDFSD